MLRIIQYNHYPKEICHEKLYKYRISFNKIFKAIFQKWLFIISPDITYPISPPNQDHNIKTNQLHHTHETAEGSFTTKK